VVDATSTKLLTEPLGGRQPEISDGDTKPVIETQHVLRLQVAMVNTEAVAILDCAKQLQENMLDETVIPQISTVIQNLSEQVSIAGILHDDVSVIVLLDHPVKGGNPWVS
jgi:hypothetical protein